MNTAPAHAGEFIKRWVPELCKLPLAYIHCPWTAPSATLKAADVQLGVNYPMQVVSLDASYAALMHANGIVSRCKPPRSESKPAEPFRSPTFAVDVRAQPFHALVATWRIGFHTLDIWTHCQTAARVCSLLCLSRTKKWTREAASRRFPPRQCPQLPRCHLARARAVRFRRPRLRLACRPLWAAVPQPSCRPSSSGPQCLVALRQLTRCNEVIAPSRAASILQGVCSMGWRLPPVPPIAVHMALVYLQ